MTRRTGTIRTAAIVLVPVLVYVSVATAQTARFERLMRDKLAYSQSALGAVVTSNWAVLELDVQRLTQVTNDFDWMVLRTPEYERFSSEFVASLERLGDAAAARSLDDAGIAYADLTTRCVNCHRYVSRARLAR
jgi:hypothetical protein